MYRFFALLIALLLTPISAHAHGGGFDLHIFGAPPVINSLIWLSLLTVIAILALFALGRIAEERVREAVRAKKAADRVPR